MVPSRQAGIEPEHHVTRLRLVSLITVVAAVGGLTAEALFSKLLGVDVPRTGGLATDGDSKKQSGAPAR